jgi:hypothetical protein
LGGFFATVSSKDESHHGGKLPAERYCYGSSWSAEGHGLSCACESGWGIKRKRKRKRRIFKDLGFLAVEKNSVFDVPVNAAGEDDFLEGAASAD